MFSTDTFILNILNKLTKLLLKLFLPRLTYIQSKTANRPDIQNFPLKMTLIFLGSSVPFQKSLNLCKVQNCMTAIKRAGNQTDNFFFNNLLDFSSYNGIKYSCTATLKTHLQYFPLNLLFLFADDYHGWGTIRPLLKNTPTNLSLISHACKVNITRLTWAPPS